ncbi:MAG: DUF288 domain-containing protein [Cytophagales bacterium]|nr:DUF288 domain-containing protein [Cytophagales bacterium]
MEIDSAYIVITTINYPTEAVKKFSTMQAYNLVVVGDKKTPTDWSWKNVNYLSLDIQNTEQPQFSKMLPVNHDGRKMLGYLHAIKRGANIIIDTDDDNIPYDFWRFPSFESDYDLCIDKGFINVYKEFSEEYVWPRGLPLACIRSASGLKILKGETSMVGVWQGLANDDPDVDAIYRLVFDKPVVFKRRSPVILENGCISPFNSQNTAFRKELFPLLYLPSFVTFRFTDILRGLVAQPIMWLYGYKLGFTEATVLQRRNPHDYVKDFISEIPMYENSQKIIEIITPRLSTKQSVSSNLYESYEALYEKNIVPKQELELLQSWLSLIP